MLATHPGPLAALSIVVTCALACSSATAAALPPVPHGGPPR
jgi:hypothetical protein